MQTFQKLKNKIKKKSAIVGIIGLGYVGLPLAIRFSESGYQIVGFDVDKNKVEKLNANISYIHHISDNSIQKLSSEGFTATLNFNQIVDCDVIIMCIPTPLTKNRDPDLSFVLSTMKSILPYVRASQIISLESTTYPGTTDEILATQIKDSGFNLGENIFLIYSPEREDPGNQKFNNQNTPKIVSGYTQNCLELGVDLYSEVAGDVIPVSSTRTAEMAKLLENIYRIVNIGLINEMKIIADKMNIDIFEVIAAAGTKPFGFTSFYPGPGVGGHCIPVDPFYLTWKAKEYDVESKFIEISGEVNRRMPSYVLEKIQGALNKNKKSVNGAKILILGVAYKKNVDDLRESSAFEILKLISDNGGILTYSDPYVPKIQRIRGYDLDLKSEVLTKDILSRSDAVVLVTDHDVFDYELIIKHSNLIIDTRGRFDVTSYKVVRA